MEHGTLTTLSNRVRFVHPRPFPERENSSAQARPL